MPETSTSRSALATYVVVLAALMVVSWFAFTVFGLAPDLPHNEEAFPGSGLLGGWYHYDGNWYVIISREGYYFDPTRQSSVAFFPAYPMVLRALGALGANAPLAGIAVTIVCGAGAVCTFASWARDRVGVAAARTAVLVLVLYPYAWYLFGAVYSDALFLFAAVGAFWLLERDRPVLAGLAGAVASAARPTGVAVVVGLVAVTVVRRGGLRAWRSLRPADAGVLLSAAGIGSWITYQWIRFGEPLAFAETQASVGWDQEPGPRTWFKVLFLQRVRRLPEYVRSAWPDPSGEGNPIELQYTLGLMLQAFFVLLVLVSVVLVVRRLGWGYGLYTLAVAGIAAVGSKDFQGTGRYMLAAFPAFAVTGQLLVDRAAVRRVWLALSATLLVWWTAAYARGYYVA